MSEWIEWRGGECPVTGDVYVRFRAGQEVLGRAEDMWWNHLSCLGSHSGGGDIVAYRIVEPAQPEAHMMSLPEQSLVRDPCDPVDTVTISRSEYDELRAEVDSLTELLEIAEKVADSCRAGEAMARQEIERLRKGKDDEQKCDRSHMVGEARPDLQKHPQAPSLAMVADTLDHRLGTPQPDGEPCEPMSARRWRWLP